MTLFFVGKDYHCLLCHLDIPHVDLIEHGIECRKTNEVSNCTDACGEWKEKVTKLMQGK